MYSAAFNLELPEKFSDWQPVVATVPRGRIAGAGVGVFDAADRLIKQSLWDEDHLRRDFPVRPPRTREVIDGRATSVLTLWADNYYHWLIDGLPRLGVLEAAGYDFRSLSVMVPASLLRFQAESLAALGISEQQHLPYRDSSARVSSLIVPSAAAVIGFCSPFIPHWLRTQFAPENPEPTRRLYVPRSVRRVANEQQIWRVLERQGFEQVRPETLSFGEQVRLFASAQVVVGPHGAGMANVAFGRSLRVLELFQPGYLNAGPYSVCRAAGHTYRGLVGKPSGAASVSKNTDMWIDPLVFADTVEELLTGL